MIGLFNTALPFLGFAYAAQTLKASTLAVLNSTAVIWGVIISYLWDRTPISATGVLGFLLVISGVVVLVGWDAVETGQQAVLPIIAPDSPPVFYGIATNYTKNTPQ
ncbi:EamA family transporter, partial [Vibrio sp. S234-5]|uniref:EamA family transporter n=1 Tax=Vibrio sp. S234-5 TaxID=1616781 RepID=UPI000B0C712F